MCARVEYVSQDRHNHNTLYSHVRIDILRFSILPRPPHTVLPRPFNGVIVRDISARLLQYEIVGRTSARIVTRILCVTRTQATGYKSPRKRAVLFRRTVDDSDDVFLFLHNFVTTRIHPLAASPPPFSSVRGDIFLTPRIVMF
jgi:hypothetical protein